MDFRDTNCKLSYELSPTYICAKKMSKDSEGVFISLDADDEYSLDFLEKMTTFMEMHNLDVAACGSDFIDAATGVKTGVRSLPADLILQGQLFSDAFGVYHQFMRTVWCVQLGTASARCNTWK
jgi:hypothetical protein